MKDNHKVGDIIEVKSIRPGDNKKGKYRIESRMSEEGKLVKFCSDCDLNNFGAFSCAETDKPWCSTRFRDDGMAIMFIKVEDGD